MRTSAAVSGKRLIDDVHILASQNDFSAIMFANRKSHPSCVGAARCG